MKRWIILWFGRAARFSGFLVEQFRQARQSVPQVARVPRAPGDAYAMAERVGPQAVAMALGSNAVLVERVTWHLSNRHRWSDATAVEAEACRLLLSWTILAAVVAKTPNAPRVLADLAEAFAIGGADGIHQQEARAYLLRELQTFRSMVELAGST